MNQFTWLRRRWKWVAAGLLVLLLPALTFLGMNWRQQKVMDEIGRAGGSMLLEPRGGTWTLTAFARLGFDPPVLAFRGIGIEFPGGRPVTTEGVRTVVEAANRLGGIRSASFGMHEALDADALRPLRDFHDLESLNLESCGLTDDDLALVSSLRQLRGLNLDGNGRVTGKGVRHLMSLPRLERLSLVWTSFRGADVIPVLRAMPSLKEVRLGGISEVPPEEVAYLKEQLPGVSVALFGAGQPVPAW